MTDDLWTIIRSSTERRVIEVLGDYLAGQNVPCRLTEPQSTATTAFSLLVPHRLWGEIQEILEWVPVSEYSDPVSPSVAAVRLALEGIPTSLSQTYSRVPGPFVLCVPRRLRARAVRRLNQSPVSVEDLTVLALSEQPENLPK